MSKPDRENNSLRHWRDVARMTQGELAELIEEFPDHNKVRKIEYWDVFPPASSLLKLSKALNVPLYKLQLFIEEIKAVKAGKTNITFAWQVPDQEVENKISQIAGRDALNAGGDINVGEQFSEDEENFIKMMRLLKADKADYMECIRVVTQRKS